MSEEAESPEEEKKAESADTPDGDGENEESVETNGTDTDETSESDSEAESDNSDSNESGDDESDANGKGTPTGEAGLTVYDFNHPQHRLGDPLPQFKHCGRKIARLVSDSIDVDLHVEASIELQDARYYKQNEFINSLEHDVSVFRSDISTFSLDLNIVFPRGLILSMVDLFFGGATKLSPETSSRALSETEKRFAIRLRTTILKAITNTCEDYFSITNNDDVFYSVDEWSTASIENTVLAVQEYKVTCKDSEHTFSIVFPWSAVESLSAYSSEDTAELIRERKQWSVKMHEHVSACAVELQGKLAETEVTVSQLLDMQKGDFIPLGDVGAATFTVDDTPIFDASIGASNGFVSASIIHWTIEGDSRHE